MADYRIYCLNERGILDLADWIDAGCDEEAVLKARELRPDARKCELWRENRLVAKINRTGRLELIEPRRPK
jgi:hypothetical protein